MATLSSLGIGKTMKNKLNAVGIMTAEELIAVGSREAIFRLRMKYPATCVVILYYLEAAILGVPIKQLPEETKLALKTYFNTL